MTERAGCHVYYLVFVGNPLTTPRLVHRWARLIYIDKAYHEGIFIDAGTALQGPFGSVDAARAALRVATGEMV